jgi:signal transduction histidine kinase
MARNAVARAATLRWVVIAFAITFVAERYGLFDLLELRTYDLRARGVSAGEAEASPLLALVSLSEGDETPPEFYGALLARLRDAGCLGVFFAVRFQGGSSRAGPWPDVGIPVYVIRPYTRVNNAPRDEAPWVGGAERLPPYVVGANLITAFSGLVADPLDGVYRRAQAHVAYGIQREARHSLELHFAAAALGVGVDSLVVPTDQRGAALLPRPPSGISTVPASDVLAVDAVGLDGRWAVVGFDEMQGAGRAGTPYGPSNAFRARAAVINGILTGSLTRPRSHLVSGIVFLVWAAVFAGAGVYFRSRMSSSLGLIAFVGAAWVVHCAACYVAMPEVWVPLVSPLVGMLFAVLAWALSMNSTRATLAERRAMQAEREASFGIMSAQVRHEVRNLLNSIRAPAEMVRNNFTKGDPLGLAADHGALAAEMDVVVSRVTQLADMVENELTYFHPDTFQFEATDLWTIAMDAREALADDLAAGDVTVTTDAADARPMVMADPAKMRVVFVNLIRNAMQAMPDGGALRLAFSTQPAPRPRASVLVQDNGIGIDSERVEQLFEPFHTTKARGLGLGLFNVNHIVTTHSGEIRAHGAPGEGATFEVLLPVVGEEGA